MAEDLLGLEGKSVLVVGGGQGMGESSARLLSRAGCSVAIVDIEAERAERVANAISSEGGTAVPLVADVLDDAQIAPLVANAEREIGGLNGVVSIVGQASWNPILEMTYEQWELDHRKNLRYFFLVGREVARSMIAREQPGAMVCITSVSGLQSAPHHAAYGAAKAGLVSLVKTMAVEWAPRNIRVNSIAPGSIITPRIPDTPERQEQTRRGLIPMQRRGTTDEIGKAAVFLLSDLASYVTGHTLPVDGGWMSAFLSGVPDVSALR